MVERHQVVHCVGCRYKATVVVIFCCATVFSSLQQVFPAPSHCVPSFSENHVECKDNRSLV